MSVHDIQSNFAPTLLLNNESTTDAAVVNTPVVDLSAGTTAMILVRTMGVGASSLSAVSLEFSVDAAFTNPVADPITDTVLGTTELGNQILLEDTQFVDPLGYDGTPQSFGTRQSVEYFVRILNPPSVIESGDLTPLELTGTAYRYARVVVSMTGTGNVWTNATQFVGPQRYVAPAETA